MASLGVEGSAPELVELVLSYNATQRALLKLLESYGKEGPDRLPSV